jgi:hypothetical protein
LAFFVILAVVCTLVVAATGKYDVAFAVLGAPVFLVAALMGHRRSQAKPTIATAASGTANGSNPAGPAEPVT